MTSGISMYGHKGESYILATGFVACSDITMIDKSDITMIDKRDKRTHRQDLHLFRVKSDLWSQLFHFL